MTIGFVGLGIMGRPMARNLCAAGFTVYASDIDPNAQAAAAAFGAKLADYEQIGRACQAIILSLPNGEIVEQVLFSENGLADDLQSGTVVADTSSITPEQSRRFAERLAGIGVRYLDCPVSGGETGAISGTLAFMVGGDEDAFRIMVPCFQAMGSSAVLVGPQGSGSVTKLANQTIVNLTIAAVSEALVLAVKCGADPEKVFSAIRGGLAGSAVLEAKVPTILARNFKPGGSLTINRKDIGNVLQTARDADVPMPFTAQLFEVMQTMKAWGRMGEDHGALVQYFEALANVEVKKTTEGEANGKL